MDGFDFEDSLSGLGESDNEPVYVPPPKKTKPKELFSDNSADDKPKTQEEKISKIILLNNTICYILSLNIYSM
jgi:hypothetical protein